MTTDMMQLDDLTWDDLTTVTRERIAGASNGQWTHHAPVDPGVTLLELYGSQLEQRLFWLDQPSEALQRSLLALLGVTPRPAKPASTVVQLWNQTHETCERIPRRTNANSTLPLTVPLARYSTSVLDQELVFQSNDQTHVFPIEVQTQPTSSQCDGIRTFAWLENGDDRAELNSATGKFGRQSSVRMWSPEKRCAFVSIRFQLANAFRLESEETVFSVLFDLDTPDSTTAMWALEDTSEGQDAIDQELDHLRFGLTLEYFKGSDESAASTYDLNVSRVSDGTDGLRRSGIVEFVLPAQALPEYGKSLTITISADTANYSFTPRIKQVIPNVVRTEHRVEQRLDSTEAEKVTRQWSRKLPGSTIELKKPGGRSRLGGLMTSQQDFELSFRDQTSSSEETWRPVQSFDPHQPEDRVFVPCREKSKLVFGDGIRGRIPVPHSCADDLELAYHWGGGIDGNVNAGLRWQAQPNIGISGGDQVVLAEIQAVNVVSGSGGRDEETLEEAIRRCRAELNSPSRTVSAPDIEELCVKTPNAGLKRAHAVVGFHPVYPSVATPGSVTVYVVPDLPSSLRQVAIDNLGDENLAELKAKPRQLRDATRFLNTKRLITQEIFVLPAQYVPIEIEVLLENANSVEPTAHKSIRQRLCEYLHPLYGAARQEGWEFGKSLRPSELMGFLRSSFDGEIPITGIGIRYENSEVDFQFCAETVLPASSLPLLKSVRVRNVASPSESGGLR